MRGVEVAARLLEQAQQLLQDEGSPAAVEVGLLRLRAEVRCPATLEPVLVDEDRAPLAALVEVGA